MKSQRITALLGAVAIAGLASAAHGETSGEQADVQQELAKLRSQVNAQQAEINQLRNAKGETWLDEQRAAEVKALVKEVLADADTRASLLEGGPVSGYKDGFFIGSDNGNFLLKINAETQIRYIFSSNVEERPEPEDDEDEGGFQLRRTRIAFSGHFISPKLTYRLREAYNRAGGNIQFDDAWVAYEFLDGLKLKGGQFKPLFLREENVSGFQQLAVERSYTSDYFTIDYAKGVELTYEADRWNAAFAFHDGSYSANTDYTATGTEFALNGRVEFLVAGDWKQFRDFTSFSSDKFGLLLGAAAAYEKGEEGGGTNTPDLYKYTVDASVEFGGANFYLGFIGQHFDDNDSTAVLPTELDDADQYSIVAQAGVFVIPDKLEPFVRYEWTDFDGVYYRPNGAAAQGGSRNLTGDDSLGVLAIGANYYLSKHNAKLTLDVLYAFDPVPVDNTGGGLLRNDEDGQVAVRAQAQFRF